MMDIPILFRVILELRLRENFLVELHAPRAPVRAGEIHERDFLFRFGLLEALFVIVLPAALREGGRCEDEGQGDVRQGE